MADMKHIVFLLLVALNAQLILGFKGAVFEHAQQSYAMSSEKPGDIVRSNLEYYQLAANFAKSKGVDVIVFPEYGIFPPIADRKRLKKFLENVPDPNVNSSVPCEEPDAYTDRPILLSLSCLARKNRMILVADMGDIQPCRGQEGCPKDGDFHFNTAVAFDRDGRILAKYHKEHLFGESGMDLPPNVQDPTFKTDLGRFAMFVCFDIVFRRITEVARWQGVKAILFPTMWVNSNPLFNSVQYYEGWAIGNDVTLLAANVQLPGESGIGSGIMKGQDGALVYTLNPDGRSKLLISDLESGTSSMYIIDKTGAREWKNDGIDLAHECSASVLKPSRDIYKDYRCMERSTRGFALQKLVEDSGHIELCSNGMCCALDYTANKIQEDFYFGVYNGTYSALNRYFFAEENCFLARCDGKGNATCVTFPMRSKTLFYDVHVKANFSTPFIYPSVMSSGLRLMPKNRWNFQSNGKIASMHFGDLSGIDLLVAGFKARAYDRDPPYVR